MNKEFLLIHKSILPEYYELVIKARQMIENQKLNVSDVCKQLDISRSTYYKYKDKIYPVGADYGKKAIISFRTDNQRGVLSRLLAEISGYSGNILTINQDMPIHNIAFITIAIDTSQLTVGLSELIMQLKQLPCVRTAELVAFE